MTVLTGKVALVAACDANLAVNYATSRERKPTARPAKWLLTPFLFHFIAVTALYTHGLGGSK